MLLESILLISLLGGGIFGGKTLLKQDNYVDEDNEGLLCFEEENLEDKQSEIKGINETQERIAKYDNTPVSYKRSWLRSRSKAK